MPIDNIETSIGLYINTLPLIVSHKDNDCIIDLIRSIQEDINEINSRSDVSLAKLQDGGERLFYSLLVYENYPELINKSKQDSLNFKFKEAVEKIDYPLVLMGHEKDNKLKLRLKYAGEFFNMESIL